MICPSTLKVTSEGWYPKIYHLHRYALTPSQTFHAVESIKNICI